jgi:hypothetical protein
MQSAEAESPRKLRSNKNPIGTPLQTGFPVTLGKQTTVAHPIRYKIKASPAAGLPPDLRFLFASYPKINRNTELIESPVSCRKQWIGIQINRNISRGFRFPFFHSSNPPVAGLENDPERATVWRPKGMANCDLPTFPFFFFHFPILIATRLANLFRLWRVPLATRHHPLTTALSASCGIVMPFQRMPRP